MSSAGFGGSAGGSYSINLQVDLISQDVNANKSTVRVNAWVHKNAGSGYYNSGSGGNINVNGNVIGKGFGGYDFRAYSDRYFASNEYYDIYHDANGNANPYFGAYYDLQNGPYLTTASTGFNYNLPQIPRYASITSFNVSSTDSEVDFNWTSSNNVDYVSWWSVAYDGGGHHDTPASGTGVFSISLPNVKSETQYDVTVAVHRADSGLWTQSGTAYTTTGKQANFFGMRVP